MSVPPAVAGGSLHKTAPPATAGGTDAAKIQENSHSARTKKII